MERKRILLAVKTPRDFQELRSTLLTAGYEMRVVDNGARALSAVTDFKPHLILSEIELPKIDGHHLLRELRAQSFSSRIPFVLISHHRSVEERVHSINSGVDEYITTPFEIKEVLLRLEIILKEIEKFENLPRRTRKGFGGKLSELNLVELLQILEIGKKSAFIKVHNERGDEGVVLVRDGDVLNASLYDLQGEPALFRMYSWSEGTFEVDLRQIGQGKVLKSSVTELINMGFMLRDRWQKLTSRLPSLETRIKPGPNFGESQWRDYEKSFLKYVRENARLVDIIEDSKYDDLKALELVAKMFRSGRIMEMEVTDELGEKYRTQKLRKNGESQVSRLVANFFDHGLAASGKSPIERRREQRRQMERRLRNRRRSDYVVEGPNTFLNKSELIMIREKLSNGDKIRTDLQYENW